MKIVIIIIISLLLSCNITEMDRLNKKIYKEHKAFFKSEHTKQFYKIRKEILTNIKNDININVESDTILLIESISAVDLEYRGILVHNNYIVEYKQHGNEKAKLYNDFELFELDKNIISDLKKYSINEVFNKNNTENIMGGSLIFITRVIINNKVKIECTMLNA